MNRPDRETAEVILGDGFKATIAERDAYHVLTIITLSDKNKIDNPIGVSYVSAVTIADSLRCGLLGMSKFRLKYWRTRRRARTKWLLKHHTQKMLNNLIKRVYDVEGIDIKKKPSESSELQSAEKSADA